MSGEKKRKNREDDDDFTECSTPKRSKTVDYSAYFSIKRKGSNEIGICNQYINPQEIKMKL